jgi:hypothetical protein
MDKSPVWSIGHSLLTPGLNKRKECRRNGEGRWASNSLQSTAKLLEPECPLWLCQRLAGRLPCLPSGPRDENTAWQGRMSGGGREQEECPGELIPAGKPGHLLRLGVAWKCGGSPLQAAQSWPLNCDSELGQFPFNSAKYGFDKRLCARYSTC